MCYESVTAHRVPLQRDHERVLVDPGSVRRFNQTSPGPTTSPTGQLLAIAGLVSSYNEKVDIFLDGRGLERPMTHFFKAAG